MNVATAGVTWKKVTLSLQLGKKKHTPVCLICFYVGICCVFPKIRKNNASRRLSQ